MLSTLFERLRQDAQEHNHRRLLVVSGTRAWCYHQVAQLESLPNLLWVGLDYSGLAQSIKPNQAHRLLGQSFQHLIFDAWSGFNPDSFGQVSGLLQGGGIFILLCPDLDEWGDYDDPEYQSLVPFPLPASSANRRFLNRVCLLLKDDPYTVLWRESVALSGVELEIPESDFTGDMKLDEAAPPHKTVDQQKAVALILSQFRRGRRPVVITADRGRGKSVALGIAAAQLSGLDFKEILITAPEYASAQEAFLIAHQLLPDYEFTDGSLVRGEHSIRFLEPALASLEDGKGKVLLVDEAAAIPVPVLKQCLQRFPRIAFASTIHGYEGTGQGFAVRFKRSLDELTPGWKGIHLKQPIRWADQDPLEHLVFDLLLLNAEAALPEQLLTLRQTHAPRIEKVDRDQLAEDYTTLHQLFGLLVLAHYRTSPGDLRVLLDSPGLHLWVVRIKDQLAAALMVTEEGPLPEDIVDPIWQGQRRPRGHLIPQTLVAQEGVKAAAPLKSGRVIRIAVHPCLQQSGLGSQLLTTLENFAREAGWDYLGSSYAVTPELINFWQRNNWQTVRLGTSKDSVSGSYAALVLKPMTHTAVQLNQVLQQRFADQFNYRLSDDLAELDPEVLCFLLQATREPSPVSDIERLDLLAFIQHNRPYESCSYVINKLLLHAICTLDALQIKRLLQDEAFVMLIRKNLQHARWDDLELAGQGRKGQIRKLRGVVGAMLELLYVESGS